MIFFSIAHTREEIILSISLNFFYVCFIEILVLEREELQGTRFYRREIDR